jgi:hypothetical protein
MAKIVIIAMIGAAVVIFGAMAAIITSAVINAYIDEWRKDKRGCITGGALMIWMMIGILMMLIAGSN